MYHEVWDELVDDADLRKGHDVLLGWNDGDCVLFICVFDIVSPS